MRSSNYLSLAAAAVLLLVLTDMEAEAIRLDAESRASVSRNHMAINASDSEFLKPSENVVVKDSTNSVRETKRSTIAAKQVRAVAHKLPEFHEDYYGPSDHSPRHH